VRNSIFGVKNQIKGNNWIMDYGLWIMDLKAGIGVWDGNQKYNAGDPLGYQYGRRRKEMTMDGLSSAASQTPQTQRLFTAIVLPDERKKALRRWVEEDLNDLPFRKWSDFRDYHITLQFLGDVETTDIPELEKALFRAAADHTPFTLGVGEAGVFGRDEFPRVLWRGVTGQRELLNQLHQSIVRATGPLGFEPEERPYRPHITVARSYTGQEPVSASILQRNDLTGEPWKVEGFVLYATRMGQKPMYQILQIFPFKR
jgi:2'-5' RNA ligase